MFDKLFVIDYRGTNIMDVDGLKFEFLGIM